MECGNENRGITAERFALWHRRSKRDRWTLIASAGSESALTAVLVKLGTGEAMTLPAGGQPKSRPRRHPRGVGAAATGRDPKSSWVRATPQARGRRDERAARR